MSSRLGITLWIVLLIAGFAASASFYTLKETEQAIITSSTPRPFGTASSEGLDTSRR